MRSMLLMALLGLLASSASAQQGSVMGTWLTASGKAVYAEAVRMIRNVDNILAEEFSATELDQLDDYLERMIGAMRRAAGGGARR